MDVVIEETEKGNRGFINYTDKFELQACLDLDFPTFDSFVGMLVNMDRLECDFRFSVSIFTENNRSVEENDRYLVLSGNSVNIADFNFSLSADLAKGDTVSAYLIPRKDGW